MIRELDIKRCSPPINVKVNRDFGSIFSMLLPGTHAKLEPLKDDSHGWPKFFE